MRFEWDSRKAAANRAKHRISFEIAQEVFADPFCFTIHDHMRGAEERLWTIGRVASLAILVVVHTRSDDGEEVIRIISARKATARERKFYEEADR